MAAYATKLTREWSLKELGYDMTIRDVGSTHQKFLLKPLILLYQL
jgi:hypothetical protein